MNNGLQKFTMNDSFIGRYERLVKEVVLPYQERALNDAIPNIEKSHCIENFKLAAEKLKTGTCSSEFYGMVFQDSDVAKWLEGAAYSLALFPDENLEKRCDEIIDLIGSAQHDDGYLNTYFTLKEPEQRWTNLLEAHELYCAGHMIEASVAYAQCTGKTKFLNIMMRMADHIYRHFIEDKAEGYPGHPEIELALMRLYDYTGEKKYLELAKHFVDVRGVDTEYFRKESEKRTWSVWGVDGRDTEYYQCEAPVREQDKAVGHAVRAVYLYTGMAAVANETKDKDLAKACKRLWNNLTGSRMYVTGGIGSAYEGEAFTADYHLPNDTAYAETCASIGLIFFAKQMLNMEKDSKYADAMERALYNCVLAGMELDGTKFFYVNPLESLKGVSGKAKTHRHALPVRPGWFTCACCPPNVARLLPSLGNYAWDFEEGILYHHLFIGGELDLNQEAGGRVVVNTGYPYDGKIQYRFLPTKDTMNLTLAIRLPFYSSKTVITYNHKEADYVVRNRYAYLSGNFSETDCVEVELDMSVKCIYANTKVSADTGKVAFSRGPLIYCAEETDNQEGVLNLRVKKGAEKTADLTSADKLQEVDAIVIRGYRAQGSEELYSFDAPGQQACSIKLIPYYAWANRGAGDMRVWIPVLD